MKRALALVLMTVLVMGQGVTSGRADVGCGEWRYFVANEWYGTDFGPTGPAQGHVHVEACLPYRQIISGPVTVSANLTMFNTPAGATINQVRLRVGYPGGEMTIAAYKPESPILACSPGSECSAAVTLTGDTSVVPYDGSEQLRVVADGPSGDGFRRLTSIRVPVTLANGGRTIENFYRQGVEGAGWYMDAGYCVPSYAGPLPYDVSGTWIVPLRFEITSSDFASPAHRFVSVDPSFHMGDPGTVLMDTDISPPGTWTGTLAVDTTQFSNGEHALFIRADCPDLNRPGNTNSGVLVVRFNVSNVLTTPSPIGTTVSPVVATPSPVLTTPSPAAS